MKPHYLFVAPPSLGALQERLQNRNTETPEQIDTRLRNAEAEVLWGTEPGNFDYVVVNR